MFINHNRTRKNKKKNNNFEACDSLEAPTRLKFQTYLFTFFLTEFIFTNIKTP